jgi:putative ABC transport system ATP-binding protein
VTLIRIESLSKKYFLGGRAVVVFDNFDLVIGEREFVGIYGPANSGKTTLLHLIAGLEKANAGRIVINDIDIAQLDDTSLSRFRQQHIAIVSAQANLLSGHTALENIEAALLFHHPQEQQRHLKAEELLRQVGAYEHREVKATGLSEEVRRRILIAKTLIHGPDILLGDALADGLLTNSTGALVQLLRALTQQGMTVLLFTRIAESACQTDRTIYLPGSETG